MSDQEIWGNIFMILAIVGVTLHYLFLISRVRDLEKDHEIRAAKNRENDSKIYTLEYKMNELEPHRFTTYLTPADLRPFWLECKEELRKEK